MLTQEQLHEAQKDLDKAIKKTRELAKLTDEVGNELCNAGDLSRRDEVGMIEADLTAGLACLVRARARAGQIELPADTGMITTFSGGK